MKPIGVVRKMDELGRIVIPKECRKVLKWGDGAPIEIFSYEDSIVLKKYNRGKDMLDMARYFVEAISSITGTDCTILESDIVLVSSNLDIKCGARVLKDFTDGFEEEKILTTKGRMFAEEALGIKRMVGIVKHKNKSFPFFGAVIVNLNEDLSTKVIKALVEVATKTLELDLEA